MNTSSITVSVPQWCSQSCVCSYNTARAYCNRRQMKRSRINCIACSYFAAVHAMPETSPYIPDNDTFKWGDLSTLPFNIHYPKNHFKAANVAVLYGTLSKRFVNVTLNNCFHIQHVIDPLSTFSSKVNVNIFIFLVIYET